MQLPPEHLSTVADFLDNPAFRSWVLERRQQDQLVWDEWLARYPEKREVYEQAVVTLLVIQGRPVAISDHQLQTRKSEILAQLPTDSVVRPLWSWQSLRWVAAAILLGLLGWWQFGNSVTGPANVVYDQTKPRSEANAWTTVMNTTGQPKLILLPDNSSVLLSTGSQLRYATHSAPSLREVYLQGEGFFEVTRNPAKPFLVYTANLTTKVLGTSFQIRAFGQEKAAYVKVQTGKVAVTPINAPEQAILLTKNEQLRLETNTEKVVKKAVAPAEVNTSSIVDQAFSFEFTPVPDVLAQLEASYHMPIRYDRKLLANCTFTGQLNGVSYVEKIRLICLTIESTFEIVDNQVIIHSRGCD